MSDESGELPSQLTPGEDQRDCGPPSKGGELPEGIEDAITEVWNAVMDFANYDGSAALTKKRSEEWIDKMASDQSQEVADLRAAILAFASSREAEATTKVVTAIAHKLNTWPSDLHDPPTYRPSFFAKVVLDFLPKPSGEPT